jgi:hypothetical protein
MGPKHLTTKVTKAHEGFSDLTTNTFVFFVSFVVRAFHIGRHEKRAASAAAR